MPKDLGGNYLAIVCSVNYILCGQKPNKMFIAVLALVNKVSVATNDLEFNEVACGSVIKLINTNSRARLHSHDVKYGAGSGQQSVTAVDVSDDHNSYWQIRGPHGGNPCTRGQPVKCGEVIRLAHLATGTPASV